MIKYAAEQYGLLSQALSEDQGSQKLLWPSSLDLQCCSQEHKQSFQQSRPRLQLLSAWDWTDHPWWAKSRTGAGSRECSGELSGYSWRWHCPCCTSLDTQPHISCEPKVESDLSIDHQKYCRQLATCHWGSQYYYRTLYSEFVPDSFPGTEWIWYAQVFTKSHAICNCRLLLQHWLRIIKMKDKS